MSSRFDKTAVAAEGDEGQYCERKLSAGTTRNRIESSSEAKQSILQCLKLLRCEVIR